MGSSNENKDNLPMLLKAKGNVALYMRRLYDRGLTTCLGGNISLRVGKYILITPSGLDKGILDAENIGVLSCNGDNLTPNLKLSIETEMHLRALNCRGDINAVVHAHPPLASLFTASSIDINTEFTAECHVLLGKPQRAPYALMGTQELAITVESAVKGANVVLMENHGILCVGKTLLEAFERIELLENAAKMTLAACSLGNAVLPLTYDKIKELDAFVRG